MITNSSKSNKPNYQTQFIRQRMAFTLIELLVVIAIIGILSGLIITTMSGATESARIAKLKVYSNSIRDTLGANLVSEWKFDGTGISDGQSANTNYTQDTWGLNIGTISGTPKVYSGTNCVSGSCLQFITNSDYISCSGGNNLKINSAMTISFWMKSTDLTTNNSRIIYKYDDADNIYEIVSYGAAGFGGKITTLFRINGTTYESGLVNAQPIINTWNQIVVTFNKGILKQMEQIIIKT